MPLYIYNSLSRKKEEFIPLAASCVKMYVCGPTVYDAPHIGHARSAYIFDLVRRYLAHSGYKIKFVRNVTDVDDKIIDKARKEFKGEDLNVAFKKVADKYLFEYHEALEKLGINSDDAGIIEPKASEYIGKMVFFIEDLILRGVAYRSGADVYFDITKAKDYGKLSHQSLEKMEVGSRVSPGENKKNPLDFALWKSAKADEPSWDSPWGKGRPGWHIECSVMSSDILGDEFDIHGGGLDLIFPHHENEIAQSEGVGKKFARYWIHHGLLTINAQKMAKSLGNFITVDDFMNKYGQADFLKLLFLSTHYSHPVDYNDKKIEESKHALERIQILLRKAQLIIGDPNKPGVNFSLEMPDFIEKHRKDFLEAMDDDFNTPRAISCLFDLVNDMNKFIDSKETDVNYVSIIYKATEEVILGLGKNILGLFSDLKWANLTDEEKNLMKERATARAKKDFKQSDELRKKLMEKGIILEDTKDGNTTWRRKL